MALHIVGPEAVLEEGAILREELPQLDQSEWPGQVLHVEDVAGWVVGWGGATFSRLWG